MNEPAICFLDANIIAKPVTRSLLMMGGPASGFLAVWSLFTEQQAMKNMRPGAMSPRAVRERYGPDLTPAGRVTGRFAAAAAITPHI